jgi:hypothetical protein
VTHFSTFARAAAAVVALAIVAPARAQMTGAAKPDLPLKMTATPTTPAVTPQDLMSRLYVFADDSMQGREAGTPGHVRGTEYIVRELTRLGVKPMGEKGSYYQVVPVADARFDLSTARVTTGGARLTPGVDFHPFPGVQDLPFALGASVKADVVFGGRFGSLTAIKADDAKGKIVVFAAPTLQGGQPGWQVFAQDEAIALYREAAAIVIASFELTPPQIWKILSEESMMLKKEDRRVPMLIVTKNAASRLIGANIDTAQVGTKGEDAEITYGPTYTDPPAPARNVIAMVEGSDPKLKGQMVVLSAHSDHVGIDEETFEHDSLRLAGLLSRPMGVESPPREMLPNEKAKFTAQLDSVRKLRAARPDSISNGADDDGSGSMGLLELAEYFQSLPAAQRPKRSILFVWNVAEEKGLFGSEWFTDHPTVPRDSLVANVNIDMIGRGAAGDIENGGMDYLQLLGSRRLSTEYGNWVEEVNSKPDFGFKLDYQFDAPGHPQQYYCRSDHWNFARWSIPTVFFSTGSHVDYHMVSDEPQYIDYPHYAKVVNFVGAFAADVANRPQRPVVDKPRPDPRGDCKQ